MAEPQKENQNFATAGTESFKIGEDSLKANAGASGGVAAGGVAGSVAPSAIIQDNGKIILNITEDKKAAVLKDKRSLLSLQTILPADLFNKVNSYFVEHSKIKENVKANFFHLLSVMINAGIPMITALKSLAQQEASNPKMVLVISMLVEKVEGGKSLSDAMLKHMDVFSEKDIGMVHSGEASGQLAGTLESLADDTLKAHEIKGKVKSAMLYPMVVMLLLVSVFVGMMVFVIPKLTELFSGYGAELPILTRIVVGISDFMLNQKIMLIGVVAALIFGFIMFKRTAFGHYALDKFKLKVPLFGALFQKAYLARFARSLSNLLNSGLSIVTTLEIVANSVGNEVYRKKLLLASEDIKQGIPMAESLAESPFFPPMILSMIEVGEKTAQLDTILAKVASFYENEVSTSVNGLSKILEPVILVVIGLSVGLVVGAIMIPIMKMSDLAGVM